MKERVWVIIDGSNFYHKLKDLKFSKKGLLEFDYGKFVNTLAGKGLLKNSRYYVGAIRTEKGNKKSFQLFTEQRKLVAKLNKFGVGVTFGYILKSGNEYHEKGVDVNMAIDLMSGAYDNMFDKLFLVSSDTDLIPAVKKAISKGKKIVYVGFSHKPSFALMRFCSETKLFGMEDLEIYLAEK